MSILFHHYKQLTECVAHVEQMEAKVNKRLTKEEEEIPTTLANLSKVNSSGNIAYLPQTIYLPLSIKRTHLAFVFPLGNDMMHRDNKEEEEKKKNNCHHLIAAATTIFLLAIAIIIVGASTSIATTPVAATTTTATTTSNNTTTTTAATSLSSGIVLSPHPIYQERAPPGSLTPINQTHISATHSGNGTLTLPNSTQTISTTSNGTAILSFATPSAYAKSTIRAANGETATLTIYEIVQFNNPAAAPQGGGKGIVTVVFQTNSTGMLAPLNGVVAAGIDNISTNGESDVTLWRWESGIPLPTGNTTATEESPSSLMNTTTTNAITALDTSATAATGEEGESQEETVEEEAVGGAEVAE